MAQLHITSSPIDNQLLCYLCWGVPVPAVEADLLCNFLLAVCFFLIGFVFIILYCIIISYNIVSDG